MKRFLSCRRSICLLLILLCPAMLWAEYRFPIGEKATYRILWGLIHCGTSTISCDEVERNGETLIRIRVRVQSNRLVSAVYPVDDTVDCFIDPATGLSVRLEKDTTEGGFVCKDILEIDRETNIAQWTSHSQNIATNYPIAAGACDAVSFLYAFRQHDFAEGQCRDYPLVVDATLHAITVTAKETADKAIGETGKTRCRSYVVTPKRDDLFVRKIPKEIWLTDDDRKILARMDVKVPVGKARIVLDAYVPPAQ